MAAEARIMEYARERGCPVPAVEDVSGDGAELTMERIDGPSMLTVSLIGWRQTGRAPVPGRPDSSPASGWPATAVTTYVDARSGSLDVAPPVIAAPPAHER